MQFTRMKTLSERLSAHLGYQFTEYPLAERFAAARRAGFVAVEHPTPYGTPAAAMAATMKELGLRMAQIGTPWGDTAKGEKGLTCLPDRVEEMKRGVAEALDYAEAIGCPYVHLMAGMRPPGADEARMWDTYVAAVRFAADAAAPRGITILLEAIGPKVMPGFFLDHPEKGLKAIAEAGRPNVKQLLDIFHVVNADIDPVAYVEANIGMIGHIQIADHPGRHEPGTGTIPFDRFFAALERLGYPGFIGCEYHPAAGTEPGLVWRDRY